MSYSGEYRDYPRPCAEGSHQRAYNGSCHVCGVLCNHLGLSEREVERRALLEALTVLVDLKDGPRDEHYYATRDGAWDDARRALGRSPKEQR